MFDIFKRKKEKIPTDKEVSKFIDVFNQLWSIHIEDIFFRHDVNTIYFSKRTLGLFCKRSEGFFFSFLLESFILARVQDLKCLVFLISFDTNVMLYGIHFFR